MKYCAAVGCAGLPHFAELNACLLRHVFGSDIPIVVRDDPSQNSPQLEQMATRRQVFYRRADIPLGHFAGDIQAFIDALALGEASEADVAIKMSQRAMVAHPDLRALVERHFLDTKVDVVMAGRPNPNRIRQGHQQYARFPLLTDIVFMRVGVVKPEWVKEKYEDQVRNGKTYHDAFVEVFWDRLRSEGPLEGRVYLMPELTEHRGGSPPLYLRRYQNRQEEYESRAANFKITGGPWDLGERAKMVRGYDPRPKLS